MPENLDILKEFIDDIPEDLKPMFRAIILSEEQTRHMVCEKVEEVKSNISNQSTVCGKRFVPRLHAYVIAGVLFGLMVGLKLIEVDAIAGLLR